LRTSGCCSSERRPQTCAPIQKRPPPVVFRAEQNVLLELGRDCRFRLGHGNARAG
jgi:hypothetical protein